MNYFLHVRVLELRLSLHCRLSVDGKSQFTVPCCHILSGKERVKSGRRFFAGRTAQARYKATNKISHRHNRRHPTFQPIWRAVGTQQANKPSQGRNRERFVERPFVTMTREESGHLSCTCLVLAHMLL